MPKTNFKNLFAKIPRKKAFKTTKTTSIDIFNDVETEVKCDDTLTQKRNTQMMNDTLVFCNYSSTSFSSPMESPIDQTSHTPLTYETYATEPSHIGWDVKDDEMSTKYIDRRHNLVDLGIYNNPLLSDKVYSNTYGMMDIDDESTQSDTDFEEIRRKKLKKNQRKRRQEFKRKKKQRKDSITICNLNNNSSNQFVIDNLSKVLQNRYSSQKPPNKQPSLNVYNTSTVSYLSNTRSNTVYSPYHDESELSDLEKLSKNFNEENDCHNFSNNNIDSTHTSNNNTQNLLSKGMTLKKPPLIQKPQLPERPSFSSIGAKSCPYRLSSSSGKNLSKNKNKVSSRRYSQQELDIMCFQAMYLVTFSRDINMNEVNKTDYPKIL